MANKKISSLDPLGATPAVGDIIPITDVSDTTGSAQGTTKKVTVANLVAAAPVQSVAGRTGTVTVDAGDLTDGDFGGTAILGFSASTTPQTGTTYTVAATDNGKVVVLDNALAITVDIDTGLPVGFNCSFIQKGAGQVTFAGTATLNNRQSHTKINAQFGVASIVAYDTDTYILAGDTAS